VISLGQTAWTTQHDYFEVWGKSPEVRFQYSAAHTAIARALDASIDASPVALSGIFTEDADPYIFAQTLHRRDLSIRWFDARDALVVSGAGGDQRIALPSFTPPDATLQSRFLRRAVLISQAPDFVLFSLDASAFTADIERWGGMVQAPTLSASSLPVSFDGNLLFLGYEQPAAVSRSESTLTLLTAWRVTSEWQPSSTAIFAHLIDANGQLAAQDDRLGFPRHNWRPGDEFVQVQRIPIGAVTPGRYTLQIGVYTRADDRRWMARDGSGIEICDRVLLGQVEVRP